MREEPSSEPTAGPPETHALGELIRETIDPLQVMQRVADQVVATIAAADGALVGLVVDGETIRYVCGSGYLSEFVGERLSRQGSLSGNAVRSGRTLITDDTERDDRVNRDATRAFDVRSSVCVPLRRGGEAVGVLNVSSRRPHAFEQHDVALLGGLAEFISTVIGAATDLTRITGRLWELSRPAGDGPAERARGPELRERFVANVLDPEGAARLAVRERVVAALRERSWSIALQPIFDVRRGEMFGAEALARFAGVPYRAPDVWLAEGESVGLGVELEVELVRSAVERLPELPGDAVMTVNAGPEALVSPELAAVLRGTPAGRIVVELTEHVAVEDYPALAAGLGVLRENGVRLAIDDAGAGFASLMHILRLAPDFIKLDRQLIRGIDLDPVRRSLASSLMRFAEETGAVLIAEGVETAGELAVLDRLGISHAQGFHLARPALPGAFEAAV
ncbi:MAG TPA: EAL domain-containing protein, partial [Solirubrobacteraceae bacterium]|nr:EAL domain-containing protein [Solirubrobacteraceae bacterium]